MSNSGDRARQLNAAEREAAGVLVEPERRRAAGQRRARRIERDVVLVRPLKVVRARPLQSRDRGGVAVHATAAYPAGDLVHALHVPQPPIDAAGDGVARQQLLRGHRDRRASDARASATRRRSTGCVPNSCCSRSTPNDVGGSTATLSRDDVGGVERVRVLARRHRRERADRQSRRETPRHLRRRQDRRVRRRVDEVASRRTARRRADAATIEPARPPDEALRRGR